MILTCKQCGTEFELTDSEIEFYNKKNLTLPKRCKDCRAANKKQRNNTTREAHPIKEKASQENLETEVKTTEKTAQTMQKRSGLAAYASKSRLNRIVAAMFALVALIVGSITGTTLFNGDNQEAPAQVAAAEGAEVYFRNDSLLEEHYEKHGKEMGFHSAEEYEAAAQVVVADPNALHKLESEDGDDVYYLEQTNEFVIVSKDGYIRTYFSPEDGINYYNRQ